MQKKRIKLLHIESTFKDYNKIKTLLEEIPALDIHVDWLSDCDDALEKISRNNYDICLLDYKQIVCIGRNGKIHIANEKGRSLINYTVPYGAKIFVKDKDKVERGKILFEWDPYSSVILTEKTGKVKYEDL